MEFAKKFLKFFLQPWSTVHRPQISSLTKAVIIGCSVSLALWALGWTLFSASADLSNRSVASVLINPDVRTIEALPPKLIRDGNCETYSISKPNPGYLPDSEATVFEETRPECGEWTSGDFSLSVGPSRWVAPKFKRVDGWPSQSVGHSRSDAIGHATEVWFNAGSSLLMPLVVLLVMQMGVFVGYQYFRRSSEPDTGDKEVS